MTTDDDIREVFNRPLPHYWSLSNALPTDIKVILYLNHWVSVPMAVLDLSKMPKSKRLARELSRAIVHTRSFGRPECDT